MLKLLKTIMRAGTATVINDDTDVLLVAKEQL